MHALAKLTAIVLGASFLATSLHADGRKPGSVLVYPVHTSGFGVPGNPSYFWTVVSVTNSNLMPSTPFGFGGSTNVEFDYVNTVPDPLKPLEPLHCFVNDVVEFLTPADTLSVLTNCHNASTAGGYLVVVAQDPTKFKTPWSWNWLIGSELVVTGTGGMYTLAAIPFESPLAQGTMTDLDGDGQLDFDGSEYEGVPDTLYVDTFLAASGSGLSLINLSGGTDFLATVKLDLWNDNEFPFSTTFRFRCWFSRGVDQLSLVFDHEYLRWNTPHDPAELDIDCNGVGELETGWFRITGLNVSSTRESYPNPALLGAVTTADSFLLEGGRLPWESANVQLNGDFLKFGADDLEFP